MNKPRSLQAKKSGDASGSVKKTPEDTTAKRAVVYLRVSTSSQVKTDYNPEGISLPAQREGCESKAASLGAEIVKEYVEPGRTATDIEHRPVFQEMLAWIKNEKNIDYVIVYHFNRIFRNSIDAHITKRELAKHGARIVSTVMDLGEGPESSMVESILHAVDQYQSQASGADISYKMAAKARSGGTLGRAPLGYTNDRDLSEGRNIGIVKFDPVRADLVRSAFELYASGDYSLDSLADELTRRGLRTRPGRFPAAPISTSKLCELLHDPYYIGCIKFKGEVFEGRHEHLVSDELFDRVQVVLAERRGRGERQRRHDHYLKGALWCGRCHDEGVESRMMMMWANGNGGRYRYFFCRRKQLHQCDSRYVEGDAIESAVIEDYATLAFPAEMANELRLMMHQTLDEEEGATKLVHQQLTSELQRLDTQEENLLDLAADGGLAKEKIKERLGKIKRQRAKVSEQLSHAGERLEIGVALIENALLILNDPQKFYERMAPEQRRILNQAIYEKIYVIEDRITAVTYRSPFDELLGVRDEVLRARGRRQRSVSEKGRPKSSSQAMGWSMPLAGIFLGNGSQTSVMVGATGLEPMTCCL